MIDHGTLKVYEVEDVLTVLGQANVTKEKAMLYVMKHYHGHINPLIVKHAID